MILLLSALLLAAAPEPLKFERIVIDANFPGGYQVEVADVNGDKKPDIVALGGSTLAWYENPSWKKRIIATGKQTPGIISSATADLDGDGKAEIAVAYEFEMNDPTKGKLLLAHPGKTFDEPWTLEPICDVPSIHRIRWMFADHSYVGRPDGGSGGLERVPPLVIQLVIAPIFGPSAKPPNFDQEPAHLSYLPVSRQSRVTLGFGDRGPNAGALKPIEITTAPVIHGIEVIKIDGDAGTNGILAASNLGLTCTSLVVAFGGVGFYGTRELVPGAPGDAPGRGASEVHAGKFKDGRLFLATVEPWHGTDVVIYPADASKTLPKFGPRTVIDATLKDGHALWVADVDGDGTDEVFAGHRGEDARVSVYRFNGKTWDRTVVDPGLTAQDIRGGDIDGDGTPDVVAIGGRSHNIVWFRPIRSAQSRP